MTGVLGYKIYIEQENSYIPSNSFYDLVGLSMIPIRDRDPLEIVDDTLNVIGAYPIIYFKEKYYELIYSKDTGFKPVIIEDLSIVSTWLINPADELITVRDYNLYETQSNKLLHELPSSIVNRLKNTKRVAFYKFIEDPTGIRESYELTDKSKITKALLSNIRLSENVSQSLSSVNIVFELTCPSVILKNSNNLSFTDSNNNSISFNVSSVANGFSITPTSTISTVGIYTISIPANTVYIFGENGQIEICPAYTFQYRIIEPSTDITTTGNDRSYYHGLLHIDNTDQNVTSANEVSFRLNDTDTILINKDKNPTISLVPQLYRVKGLISEVIPYNEISGVLFTYSYYDNEVLVTTNTNIDYYSQAGDQTDILSEVGLSNPVYIKCSVQFTYRSNTIQQGFELYFLSNSLYTSIQSNQNYYVSGYIDTQNGQVAEQKCGCLLLTNLYDIYKTIEVVENNQTVVKGIADIVPNTKVRMGNLTGIHNYTFGKNQPRGYGLYGESVYLTGNFYLNNGRSLVDIDRDILLAVGNIKEVERYLESLESSIRATIEANSIITEANYTGAISVNNNALLRLGLDYSLWALGNAGIVLMNPNATYNADGEVEPSTVGDGDEAILMQGDSIKFTNYKTKELTIDNVTATYKEVICSNVSPTGWQYNSSIYQPSDGNNLVEFYLGYILDYPTTKNHIDRLENQSSQEYLKYVGFTDISGQTGCITDTGTFTSSPNPKEYYLFNSYYVLPSNGTVYDKDGNVISHPGEVFILPRVVIAGMFKNGKFNSDFIETKNLLAFDETIGHGFIRNPNFDITQPVSDSNYPVLNGTTNQIDKTAPFVVISGTTGQMVAQGIDLKEATVSEGNNGDQTIHIVNNDGFTEESDPTADYPAIYFKKGDEIRTKISSIGQYTSNDRPVKYYETPQEVEEFNITSTGNIGTNSNNFKEIKFENFKLNRKLYNSSGGIISLDGNVVSGGAQKIYDKFDQYFNVTLNGGNDNLSGTISGRYKLNNNSFTSFSGISSNGLITTLTKVRYSDTITIELPGEFVDNGGYSMTYSGYIYGYSIHITFGTVSQFSRTYDSTNDKTIITLSQFKFGDNYSSNSSQQVTTNTSYNNNGTINIFIGGNDASYIGNSCADTLDGKIYDSNFDSISLPKRLTIAANLVNTQVSAVRYTVDSTCTQSIYDYGYNFYSNYNPNDSTTFEKSDCRKFIKIIKKFTVKAGQSKQISLKQAKADFYLNESAIQNFIDSSGTNQTNVSSTNEFKAFAGYLSLISGFRVSWISSKAIWHDHILSEDQGGYTYDYTLNHKWISQQNCVIKRDKEVYIDSDDGNKKKYKFKDSIAVNQLTNKEYPINSIDIINNSDSDKIYYLEYAVLLQIDNEYDINSYIITEDNNSSITPGSIIGGDEIQIHTINPSIIPIYEKIPSDHYYDSDNFKNPLIGTPSSSSLISENWHPAQAPITYDFSDTNEHKTRIILKGYQISIFDNKFQTNLQGNGLGLGINQNNYFGTYLIQNQSSSVNFNLLSCGNGLSFSENEFNNILFGKSINRFIPILQGKFKYGTYVWEEGTQYENEIGTYTFEGISLMDTNSTDDNIFMTIGELNGWWCDSSYSNKHDLYIARPSGGWSNIYVIFGESWNQLFNKFGFEENQIFVYLNGINHKTYDNIIVSNSRVVPAFTGVENYLEQTTQVGLLVNAYGEPINNTPNLLRKVDAQHILCIDVIALINNSNGHQGDFHISLQYSPKFQS